MENEFVKLAMIGCLLFFMFTKVPAAWKRSEFQKNIKYDYFEGVWEAWPDFTGMTPLKTGSTEKLDLSEKQRDENFAFRFKLSLDVPVEGKFTFLIKTADRFQLVVNNKIIVDNSKIRENRVVQIDELVSMNQGVNQVEILYVHGTGPRVLELDTQGPVLYRVDRLHWLYFGWENDYPKSWSFMGGSLNPGRQRLIQYTVQIGKEIYFPDEFGKDRKSKIKWHLAEGYLPSPISEWKAGNIAVTIQHFANRILDDKTTAVYSRIGFKNVGKKEIKIQLDLNASMTDVVCLTRKPLRGDDYFSTYEVKVNPGKTAYVDFVTVANGLATVGELKSAGNYNSNYKVMADYYQKRIGTLTHPVNLPDKRMIDFFKSNQIVMWESLVRKENGDVEMRGSGGNPAGYYQYDRTFSHDVPNMVDQFVREGDFAVAKQIMESSYYQKLGKELEQSYLDAIPKYIVPYALYLQLSGDVTYFSPALRDSIKSTAHRIHDYRNFSDDPGHNGIMQKSNSLDNRSDHLLIDNFAALHGLTAYKYICDYLGDTAEADWATREMEDLNTCFNNALKHSMERRKVDWYMTALDDETYFWKRGYDGNWIGTSLMMSTFPWNAALKGFTLGGVWKDSFDRSIENALHLRDISPYNIPPKSWGAWWGHEYGACYNAGMGLQLLYSDKHRTEVIRNIEFLIDNQSAPYQWGESFDRGYHEKDWSTPAADYETWGLGFNKQALLEACVAVYSDGTVIIGRGIPEVWSKPGQVIEWKNVRINKNKKLDLKIHFLQKEIQLNLTGDQTDTSILLNLPILKGNIAGIITDGSEIDSYDLAKGKIMIPATARSIIVRLKH